MDTSRTAPSSEPSRFGALLHGYRVAAGLSQAELAERGGLSARAISDLERGARRFPYPTTVRRLARALSLGRTERAALLAARGTAATAASGAHGLTPIVFSDSASGGRDTPVGIAARPVWRSSNLPAQVSSFVGREREIAAIKQLLQTTRLLTLTGPGGVGKTRLALEVAGQLDLELVDPTYVDGIWQVELAPLTDGALVPRAVASSLGVREISGEPVLETVINWLHRRKLLIILDNCEHLVAACAAMAAALLRTTSGLTILATSREALNVAGEVVWPVEPMAADSEGPELFADRARAASPSFELTTDTRATVVRVCQQLDGLPLAIELAAARVNALTVEEIEKWLDRRFALLTAGRRSSPPRHQTLRALIDWSYELLTTEEQRLLQQVSVFAGGWTLEAADAVCEPTLDVLRLLPSLVDKSLVQVEQRTGQSRYRLLETLRQYGMDKLRAAQAERLTRTRHLRWCELMGRAAQRELFGPRHKEWFMRLEADMDNFRAALAWSLLEPAGLDIGLRLAASLARSSFWNGRYGVEGSEWLETLLARSTVSTARVEALAERGFLLVLRGDCATARPLLEEAVALARQLEDRCLLGIALNHLGLLRFQEGDLTGTHTALEECLVLTAERGDCPQYWTQSKTLNLRGELAELEGDWDTASSFYERSLTLARAQQDEWRTVILRCMGRLALKRGDLAAAHAQLTESLIVACEWGFSSWTVASVLVHLAGLALADGQPERAMRLAGAGTGLREKQQARLQPLDVGRLEAVLQSAGRAVGKVAAAQAWADGHAMTPDQAVAYALESTATQPAAVVGGVNLTPRELEVARLLGRFATNREIAAQLIISERTAKRHVENILLKLGLRSRAQVAEWASALGVLLTD